MTEKCLEINENLKIILERRSITFFDKTKEIEDELLIKIVELASLAPSSYNLQPWEVIIVKNKENKKKLREICFNQEKVEDASANIVVIANYKRAINNIERVLDDFKSKGYPISVNKSIIENFYTNNAKMRAVRDASLFAMNLMLIARFFNLETHPMEGFNEKLLREFLNIEDYKEIPLIIAIGYKDLTKELLPQGIRFPFSDFGKII
ncbi:MAG: nitroreductase family protein [bacterium]|nr:nitroreductase family protein [bacterium]